MGHENGGKQRLAKRRHVQGMLDETDPLIPIENNQEKFLRIIQRLRSRLSPLPMTLALLYDNKGLSAVVSENSGRSSIYMESIPLNQALRETKAKFG